jgi:hypothetical protein
MNESTERDIKFEKALEALESAENKIYKPLNIFDPGFTSFNFLTYMKVKDVVHPTPDFFVEFAKDTEKKLHIHPLYVLNSLKEEYRSKMKEFEELKDNGIEETYIPTFEEFMSGRHTGKGIKKNIDEEIELNRAYRSNLHKAISKLSKENPSYIV